ncbi:hypothetical protein ACB092_11G010300 [Castanea dentata]
MYNLDSSLIISLIELKSRTTNVFDSDCTDNAVDVMQEAHVVEDLVTNLQRLCPICDNAIGVAFCCGHQFCVECGDRYSTCPICRDRVHIRFRVF